MLHAPALIVILGAFAIQGFSAPLAYTHAQKESSNSLYATEWRGWNIGESQGHRALVRRVDPFDAAAALGAVGGAVTTVGAVVKNALQGGRVLPPNNPIEPKEDKKTEGDGDKKGKKKMEAGPFADVREGFASGFRGLVSGEGGSMLEGAVSPA